MANDYFDRTTRTVRYAVSDPTSTIVDAPGDTGRSPVNLLHTAVGDWLKADARQSKVLSVAIKDRSAVLMGGRDADAAYWYHPRTGHFVTSSYYLDAYPRWVSSFNERGSARAYFDSVWTRMLPESEYGASREDAFALEADGVRTTFPHRLGREERAPHEPNFWELPLTPFGDQLVLEFAQRLIAEESLGKDAVPDIVFVGLSSADYIGHHYGPYSQEVQDYYLRLDRALGAFFEFIEAQAGPGRYLIALTADHGVAPMPEELARRGVEGAARVDAREVVAVIERAIEEAVNEGAIFGRPTVHYAGGFTVDFGDDEPPVEDQRALYRRIAERLNGLESVGAAYTYDDLKAGTGDEFRDSFGRSFHPERAADVLVRFKEHRLVAQTATGTSHGSPYRYDTHVPLVFAGGGVLAGRRDEFVRTVDLPVTVAAMLGLGTPGDVDGRDLRVRE